MVVHYYARPIVVVPHPLLSAECAALSAGPVVIGWDGSAGSETALSAAARLLPERDLLLVSVEDDTAPAPTAEEVLGRKVSQLNVGRRRGLHAPTVADALITTARERSAAVIVVGSRGRSAAFEIVLGGVAMATLHRQSAP
jgi:nucleotide-binding universal stress UspA family protein